jgi:two-component system copper resistance phosphate regulon response regulator CusR
MRVKALLHRTSVERTDVVLISNLEVNRLTRQVSRGGQRIELTGKEYALLEYLLSSPSRVFSRAMILEHVWDQSFEGVTNIVDVYVRHLRRKVDDPFAIKLIHTVRGVGYCVRESPLPTESEQA